MASTAERRRDERNLNPTAPEVVAMNMWGSRYCAQNGGSMDFWDSLSVYEQKFCEEIADKVRAARHR
jgi:putative hemolysin